MTILFMSPKYAFRGNEELNDLFNEIGLKMMLMLKAVKT